MTTIKTSDSYKEILVKSARIIEKYEKEKNENGYDFNVFEILGLSSNETRLHSKFLAEFFKNDGSHGFKDAFFKEFIDLLKNNSKIKEGDNGFLSDFLGQGYSVKIEFDIGLINSDYTKGGRIDLIIENKKNEAIIIENKIFARDQENQLLRYDNFRHEQNYNKSILLYLTLDGEEPSIYSAKDLKVNKDYYCISYKSLIIEWLEVIIQNINKDKIKDSQLNRKRRIESTIIQYKNIIETYTKQNNRNKMQKNIQKLFCETHETYKAAQEIKDAFEKYKKDLNNDFNKLLDKELFLINGYKRNGDLGEITFLKNEIFVIRYHIDKDEDGFFIGVSALHKKTDENANGNDSKFDKLAEKLKTRNFINNQSFIGWRFIDKIGDYKEFITMDGKDLHQFFDRDIFEKFVREVAKEINQHFEFVKDCIVKLNSSLVR